MSAFVCARTCTNTYSYVSVRACMRTYTTLRTFECICACLCICMSAYVRLVCIRVHSCACVHQPKSISRVSLASQQLHRFHVAFEFLMGVERIQTELNRSRATKLDYSNSNSVQSYIQLTREVNDETWSS